jgi:D-inositol-3-phosphate glycosyltransferase
MGNLNGKEPRVLVISSLTGGLGHYCSHLSDPLSKLCSLRFMTYPQIDLSGVVSKQITDSFIRTHIKRARFDLDENNVQSIIAINDYIKKRDLNVVNIHVGTTVKRKISYFVTLILYIKKLNQNKVKFVFTLHDVLPFDEDSKLNKLVKVFYGMADAYVVGNEGEKHKLVKHFGVSENKISVIPHGIYDLFDRNLYNQQSARSYLGLPKDKKVMLFFGFLREYKGFDYLIRAAKILSKKRNDFLVYVASGLKYAPKSIVESDLRLIQKNNLQDVFSLNLNYLDSLDIESVFEASDFTVLPYTHASQSGVMMMSFGFRKPVVITDAFFDKAWVEGKAGYVARTMDSASLAEKINEMLDNPQKMKEFGEYGYEYAKKNCNWVDIAKKYYDLYLRILKK